MILLWVPFILVFLLAYANGANDNFKGVATLYGSKTLNYRKALALATITTALGSICAIFFARKLLATFSGKGLIPSEILSVPTFPLAVGAGAALTILLATYFGFPVSTTHGLIGGLIGTGLLASPQGIIWDGFFGNFMVPLLVSPLIALLVSYALYPISRSVKNSMNLKKEICICIENRVLEVLPAGSNSSYQLRALKNFQIRNPTIKINTMAYCQTQYKGRIFGIQAKTLVDRLHFMSAGAVCFSRALNDTPKIAAVLLASTALNPQLSLLLIGFFMVIGGVLNAEKVADTLSNKVSEMNDGQGLLANLVTSFLVLFASNWGIPVSTTHVSTGSIIGIGLVTKQAKWSKINQILLAWLITLPMAAISSAIFYQLLNSI